MLYKAVAQTVLLYGCKIWLVTGAMLKVMEEFHQRAARRILVITARCAMDGEWKYPSMADGL